jgi:hypothetical protein
MGRERRAKGYDTSRDSGPFVALPFVVLDCPAYLALSHPAKALLLEIARQYVRDNNGRLLASRAYLANRGWKSADTITRAVRELTDAKLIHQTVQGHFPKTASWYAVTWRTLDRIPGYDAGAAESFERGAYAKKAIIKITKLRPPSGPETLKIGPSAGPERVPPRPPDRPIKPLLDKLLRPPDGHHLDKPSTALEPESCQQPGSYLRLMKPIDGRGWLPVGLIARDAVPNAVTRKAAKHLAKLERGVHDAIAIQAGRAACLSLGQLIEWAGPCITARALAVGNRQWRDLWTHTKFDTG